jgi:sodium/bile acid cotransporter 7
MRDWFLLGMVLAVVLAWLLPGPGATGGWLHPEILTRAAVGLVFLLQGLGLPWAALHGSIKRWRLHLLIQSATFLLFPLLAWVACVALDGRWSPELRTGFILLCALPSTISSSVALTAAAGGNVPVALFNASVSSLVGVVLTPFWLGLFVGTSGGVQPLGDVFIDLVGLLVVPLAVGQMLRRWWADWATKHKALTRRVDRGSILLLIYTAFCGSFHDGIWAGHSPWLLGAVLVGCFVIFTAAMLILALVSRWCGLAWPDRIAVLFCGSKKSLAAGVPMAHAVFAGHAGLGVLLMPLMIYHAMQLFICGILANRWHRAGPPPPSSH